MKAQDITTENQKVSVVKPVDLDNEAMAWARFLYSAYTKKNNF